MGRAKRKAANKSARYRHKRSSQSTSRTLHKFAHEADIEELRDGRKLRAATFVDRRKQASKDACRNRKEQEC